ncbi:MAG: NAD(P)-binding protein, partial [Paracoccaceae bacterium]|nr:NAD(P)-binding protein [Paracoccaceae bacterium]
MTLQDLEHAPQAEASSMGSVLVIGAGFGGIAAALRMRAKGFEVTLVDRLQAIGGRAQVFERGGFRHDAGPTVITAPFFFDELFEPKTPFEIFLRVLWELYGDEIEQDFEIDQGLPLTSFQKHG